MLVNSFEDSNFMQDFKEVIESFEIRLTSRANIVQKKEGGSTYWMDAGVSFGYEF